MSVLSQAAARTSADLAVLAVDGLLRHPEQRADLGPAETCMSRTSYGNLFTTGQLTPPLPDRGKLTDDTAGIVRIEGGPHPVSMC